MKKCMHQTEAPKKIEEICKSNEAAVQEKEASFVEMGTEKEK